MPISLTCEVCDFIVKIPADSEPQSLPCPKCGEKVYHGDRDEIDRLEDIDEDRKDRRERKGKKKRKARIEGLANVNRGLALHYAGVLVFMLALWMYWLALAVAIAALFAGNVATDGPSGFLNAVMLIAIVIGGLATVLEIPAAILCLFVPDGSSKGLAIAALCLRAILIGATMWYAVSRDGVAVALSAIFLIAAFMVWMFFLRRVSSYLGQHGLARDSISIMFQSIFTSLATFLCLFFITLLIRLFVYVQSPVGRAIVVGSFMGPLATFVAAWFRLSGGDSVLRIVLYPTGIPFLLNYLELVSGLRTAIMRRA